MDSSILQPIKSVYVFRSCPTIHFPNIHIPVQLSPRLRNLHHAASSNQRNLASMTSPEPFSDEAYLSELEAASTSDLSLVEDRGIVTVYTSPDSPGDLLRDGDGNFIVTIVPANVPSEKGAWEKSFLLFLRETAEVSPFTHPPPFRVCSDTHTP